MTARIFPAEKAITMIKYYIAILINQYGYSIGR